jgi:hypothetical protein
MYLIDKKYHLTIYLNFLIMQKLFLQILASHLNIHLLGYSFGNVRCCQASRLRAADHLAAVRLPLTDPFDTPFL